MSTSRRKPAPKRAPDAAQLFDLGNFAPFYLTAISNKLTRGASRLYLDRFGVGIVEWRAMVTLAVFGKATAQDVCRLVGLDKAAVSRAFSRMEEMKLIAPVAGDVSGRAKPYKLTPAGKAMHDRILVIALEREDALLAPLSPSERKKFIEFLRRIHEHLPHAALGAS